LPHAALVRYAGSHERKNNPPATPATRSLSDWCSAAIDYVHANFPVDLLTQSVAHAFGIG